MRTFKFRAWDNLKQEFLFIRFHKKGKVTADDIFNKYWSDDWDDLIVQQYIGKQDINGKDIYEGDIIASRGNFIVDELTKNGNYPDIWAIVKWNNRNSEFVANPINYYVKYNEHDYWNLSPFQEVIGNIFQNMDLLNCKTIKKSYNYANI